MPCNSSYLEPREEEKNRKRIAQLIIYIDGKLSIKTPKMIIQMADSIYGEGKLSLDEIVARLCGKISKMTEKQKERIVYNAKNKDSRDLANWWEEHQEADKQRIAKEKKEKAVQKVKEGALSKLSPKERKALRV